MLPHWPKNILVFMGVCFESEGIKLLQLRKFLYHINSLSQLLYVFHHIATSLFQEISCSIQIHLWLLLHRVARGGGGVPITHYADFLKISRITEK